MSWSLTPFAARSLTPFGGVREPRHPGAPFAFQLNLLSMALVMSWSLTPSAARSLTPFGRAREPRHSGAPFAFQLKREPLALTGSDVEPRHFEKGEELTGSDGEPRHFE